MKYQPTKAVTGLPVAAFATPYKKHIQYNINSNCGGILIAYSIEYRKELSNMKKSIIIPLAAVLCLSLLAGCNAKDKVGKVSVTVYQLYKLLRPSSRVFKSG